MEDLAMLSGKTALGGLGQVKYGPSPISRVALEKVDELFDVKSPAAGRYGDELTQANMQPGGGDFAGQVLNSVQSLVDSMNQGTPIEITTNLQLDGKTIDTITQKTSTRATKATKDEMKRRALNLPVVNR
jgi:hypothetical protein